MILAPGTVKIVVTNTFLAYGISFKFSILFNTECAQGASFVHTVSHLQEAY